MNLPTFVLRNPVTALMGLICLVVLGAAGLQRLPLAFMPQIENPLIEVRVERQAQPGWVMEETVTRLLEEELARIPGHREMRSNSTWNQSEVTLFFEWGVDLDLKKAEVREAVDRVRPKLPDDLTRVIVSSARGGPGERSVVSGRISSGRDLSQSYDLIELKILRPIERIPGVASVNVYGVDPSRVQVELDPEALERHGVSVMDVLSAVNGSNVDMAAGVIRDNGNRYPLRSLAAFRSMEEIRTLPVRPGLSLKDVARVEIEEPPLWMGRHLNGDFAIGIDIQKEPTANTVEVVERIHQVVEEIRADPSMQGIDFLIWHDEAKQIQKSLRGLRNAGIFGGILAIGVLIFFLGSWRTTAIVGVAIPFSLVTACGFLYLFGKELNVLSLLGLMLGVGMLVDNSVVVMENIHRHREKGMGRAEAARVGAKEVTLAVTAATATTLCVWIPFFLGKGDEFRTYITEIAVAMCLTIGSSLLIGLTFIPLAAARFTTPGRTKEPGRLLRAIQRIYGSVLRWTLRHRPTTLVLLSLLLASMAVPFSKIEKDNDISEQEPDVEINFQFTGTFPLERTREVVREVEGAIEPLREELGFEYVYSYFGHGWAGVRAFWEPEKASEETLESAAERIKEVMPTIAGVKIVVGEEIRPWRRRHRRGGGATAQFRVILYGDEVNFLAEKAEEVEEALRAVPGVNRVHAFTWGRNDEMHIQVDRELARARGLSPQEIGQVIGFQFQGRTLRRFRTEDKELDVFLGMKGWDEEGMHRLLDLRVPTEGGETVPVVSLAEFRRTQGRHDIRKENRRLNWVLSVQHDPEQGPQVRERVRQRMERISFPGGGSWEIGQQREAREQWKEMLVSFGLALLLVYIVMASLFESLPQPFAIIISLPLAAAGVFWVLWATGAKFDSPAYIGCIVLLGIVVNNGIVLVDHVNQYRRRGVPFKEALVNGSEERLRPILMTAVTTIIGLAPMAFGRATVANVYIDTMAMAIIGGLATSTLLTLVALPTWASLIHDAGVFTRRLAAATRRARPGEVPPPGTSP